MMSSLNAEKKGHNKVINIVCRLFSGTFFVRYLSPWYTHSIPGAVAPAAVQKEDESYVTTGSRGGR